MKMLTIAKAALYGIFLNYYSYYVIVGSFIPMGTIAFLGIAGVCVIADIRRQGSVYISREIWCWIFYAIFSLLSTLLITIESDSLSFISDIVKYVQRLAIIMMIAYICEREKSIRFGLQLMAVTAFASAISVLLTVDDIQRKLSVSTGADLSANDIGAIMSFGCFAILYAWGRRGKSSLTLSALKTIGVIACICVIFLAGSRKSIFAVVVMLVLMIPLCFRDYSRHFDFRQFLTVLLIGVAAYLFVSKYLLPVAEQTNLYQRLFGRGAEAASESDEGRIELYIWAFEDFLENPFFGSGFNQYVKHHGNYTHSTYAEPLACSGLLGLLYLYPYYSFVKKQFHLIRANARGSLARLKQKELLVYLGMCLFVGIGIPYMYKDVPCILLGTFIASQRISFDELKVAGCSSDNY